MAIEAPGEVGRLVAELDLSSVWAVDRRAARRACGHHHRQRPPGTVALGWTPTRTASTRAAWSSRPVSSICTCTCANPATRTPRRSRADSLRRRTAGSPRSTRHAKQDPRSTSRGVGRIRGAAAASGSPVELLAYGAVTAGARGDQLAALGELGDAGVVGFSDDGAPVRSAQILSRQRPGLRPHRHCPSSTTPRTPSRPR